MIVVDEEKMDQLMQQHKDAVEEHAETANSRDLEVNMQDGVNTADEVVVAEAGGLAIGGETAEFGTIAADVEFGDDSSSELQEADQASESEPVASEAEEGKDDSKVTALLKFTDVIREALHEINEVIEEDEARQRAQGESFVIADQDKIDAITEEVNDKYKEDLKRVAQNFLQTIDPEDEQARSLAEAFMKIGEVDPEFPDEGPLQINRYLLKDVFSHLIVENLDDILESGESIQDHASLDEIEYKLAQKIAENPEYTEKLRQIITIPEQSDPIQQRYVVAKMINSLASSVKLRASDIPPWSEDKELTEEQKLQEDKATKLSKQVQDMRLEFFSDEEIELFSLDKGYDHQLETAIKLAEVIDMDPVELFEGIKSLDMHTYKIEKDLEVAQIDGPEAVESFTKELRAKLEIVTGIDADLKEKISSLIEDQYSSDKSQSFRILAKYLKENPDEQSFEVIEKLAKKIVRVRDAESLESLLVSLEKIKQIIDPKKAELLFAASDSSYRNVLELFRLNDTDPKLIRLKNILSRLSESDQAIQMISTNQLFLTDEYNPLSQLTSSHVVNSLLGTYQSGEFIFSDTQLEKTLSAITNSHTLELLSEIEDNEIRAFALNRLLKTINSEELESIFTNPEKANELLELFSNPNFEAILQKMANSEISNKNLIEFMDRIFIGYRNDLMQGIDKDNINQMIEQLGQWCSEDRIESLLHAIKGSGSYDLQGINNDIENFIGLEANELLSSFHPNIAKYLISRIEYGSIDKDQALTSLEIMIKSGIADIIISKYSEYDLESLTPGLYKQDLELLLNVSKLLPFDSVIDIEEQNQRLIEILSNPELGRLLENILNQRSNYNLDFVLSLAIENPEHSSGLKSINELMESDDFQLFYRNNLFSTLLERSFRVVNEQEANELQELIARVSDLLLELNTLEQDESLFKFNNSYLRSGLFKIQIYKDLEIDDSIREKIELLNNEGIRGILSDETLPDNLKLNLIRLLSDRSSMLSAENFIQMHQSGLFGEIILTFENNAMSENVFQILISENAALAKENIEQILQSDIAKIQTDNPFISNAIKYELIKLINQSESIQEDIKNLDSLLNESGLIEYLDSLNGDSIAGKLINRVLNSKDIDLASRIIEIGKNTKFYELIGDNGAAYSMQSQLLEIVLNSDKKFEVANEFVDLFNGDLSLWAVNYKLSKIAVGEISEVGKQTGLIVNEIPSSLPLLDLNQENSDQIYSSGLTENWRDMPVEQRRLHLADQSLTDEEILAMDSVDFDLLNPETKTSLLAYRLFEVITLSRSEDARARMEQRNRQIAESGVFLHEGDLIHATNMGSVSIILSNGLLSGETHGVSAAADAVPFNLDMATATPEVMTRTTFNDKINSLMNIGYGEICFVLGRGEGSLRQGEEFDGIYEGHKLLLAGMPSTEVTAIIIRSTASDAEMKVDKIINRVVNSGMYIPVVDAHGELRLTYEEYQQLREDRLMDSVDVETIDSSFRRTGTQKGSNEGAEFVIPIGNGETETWYVKFGDENPDHTWNEVLSDGLYRLVDPELVPETRVVRVEGRIARASKMVVADEGVTPPDAIDRGFILDSWLGNWDAVYNSANIFMSGGVGMRIDMGNTLNFRARGERKPKGTFGPIVEEIEEGSDKENLGGGMRQMYPDLTDDEIRTQVIALRDRATDEAIDDLVDSVRLPSEMRQEYKQVLKQRRDYIIKYFSSLL